MTEKVSRGDRPDRLPSSLRPLGYLEALDRKREAGVGDVRLILKKDGKTLFALGHEHVRSLAEADPLLDAYTESGANVVLYEGSPVDVPEDMQDEDIVEQFGEQVLLSERAKRENVPVISWDLPLKERLARSIKEFGFETTVLHGLAHIVQFLRSAGEVPTNEKVANIMRERIPMEHIPYIEEQTGLRLRGEDYDYAALWERATGVALVDATQQEAANLLDPSVDGETNRLNIQQNFARDEHALGVIAAAIEEFGNVFVSGAGHHVYAWESALRQHFDNDK